MTEKDFATLRASALFQEAAEQTLRTLEGRPGSTEESFPAGASIYTREDYRQALGVVLEGSAQVSRPKADGQSLFLSVLSTGGIFGAAALFNDRPDYVSEITAQEHCRILFLTQDLMEQLMREDFRIARNYIVYLSGRIRFMSSRIDCFTGQSPAARLARFLCDSAERTGETVVNLPFGMAELARLLDLSRPSLYRALDALAEKGLISHRLRTITLLDTAALQQVR